MFTFEINIFRRKYFRITLLSILFIAAIGILVTSFLLRSQPPLPAQSPSIVERIYDVQVVTAGKLDSYASALAEVKNKNEITIKAISTGVITRLSIKEGGNIDSGNKILEIAENYNKDNSIDLQIEIAQKQLQKAKANEDSIKNQANDRKNLVAETYADYLNLLELNRKTIDKLEEQIELTESMKDKTEELIDDYEEFEDDIEDYYENQNMDFLAKQGVLENQTTINNFKNASRQYQITMLDLKDQLEILKYQTSPNSPAGEVAELNRDLALAQLKTQQDIADIDTELAALNIEILTLQKSLYSLRSPVSGKIEKIYVNEGEVINSGQNITLISGKMNMILSTLVTADLINKIDSTKDAIVTIEDKEYKADIESISTTPVENGYFEILLDPENTLEKLLLPGNSVKVEFTLSTEFKKEADILYLPVDSIFKTNTREYVLIAQEGKAIQKDVKTGDIVGNQIEILEGIEKGDIVIKDRRIVPDEKIRIISQPTT